MEGSGAPAGVPSGNGDGQEQSGNDGGLDPGLFPGIDQVPQEYRQHLDPILKEVNTNANKRISEVNEKLNTWKPYEELGVHEAIDPESMEGVMNLLQAIDQAEQGDPSGFKQWWEAVGNEYGLMEQPNEGNEEFDGEVNEEVFSPEELKEIIANEVQNAVSPFVAQQQEQEQEKQFNIADKKLDEEVQAIKDEHGDFNEDIEAKICKLALAYPGEGAFTKGFEDYKQIVEDAKGELFAQTTNQPEVPQGPAVPDTNPTRVKGFKGASEAARERLEASS